MVERHPLGTQTFFPLSNADWFVVVAPPGDAPELRALRAFRATGSQGVNYHRGVWHHPLLVLRPDHEFLVIDRGGRGENCDEMWFHGRAVQIPV